MREKKSRAGRVAFGGVFALLLAVGLSVPVGGPDARGYSPTLLQWGAPLVVALGVATAVLVLLAKIFMASMRDRREEREALLRMAEMGKSGNADGRGFLGMNTDDFYSLEGWQGKFGNADGRGWDGMDGDDFFDLEWWGVGERGQYRGLPEGERRRATEFQRRVVEAAIRAGAVLVR
jgi:hypothetical protein